MSDEAISAPLTKAVQVKNTSTKLTEVSYYREGSDSNHGSSSEVESLFDTPTFYSDY